MTLITLEQILKAHGPLKAIVRCTSLLTSKTLDGLAGGPIQLKAENLQKTGSFKIRGAYPALSRSILNHRSERAEDILQNSVTLP